MRHVPVAGLRQAQPERIFIFQPAESIDASISHATGSWWALFLHVLKLLRLVDVATFICPRQPERFHLFQHFGALPALIPQAVCHDGGVLQVGVFAVSGRMQVAAPGNAIVLMFSKSVSLNALRCNTRETGSALYVKGWWFPQALLTAAPGIRTHD